MMMKGKMGKGKRGKRRYGGVRSRSFFSYWVTLSRLLCFMLILSLLFQVTISLAYPQNTTEFKPALPGWKYVFPRDHGAHREFKTEWWYYNGHLQDTSGNRYGYQMTFFRVGLIPGKTDSKGSRWRAREAYLAHLTVTDFHQGTFRFQEKADRGNLGLAGADEGRYRVWVENWQAFQAGREHQIAAGDKDLGFSLKLLPLREPTVHGVNGVSQKGAGMGRASHYYSITRMETSGVLKLKGQEIQIHGLSWMDHEFGSNQLAEDQIGWDWFSVQLSNGMDLMIYQLRRIGGEADPYSSGTLIFSDLRKRHLPWYEIQLRTLSSWKSPKSGATYPSAWEIELPHDDLKLSLVPVMADQELLTPKSTGVTYWEGKVQVQGAYKGEPIAGNGYVELTGYDAHFKPKI